MTEASGPSRPVLILGWRGYLVEAAHRLGLAPVVVYGPGDKNWAEPDLTQATMAVFAERPAEVECVLLALSRYGLGDAGFVGVCPGGEDTVVLAAVLSVQFGLAGRPSVATAVAARDKSVQKALLRRAGVPAAASVTVDDIEDVHFAGLLPEGIGYPAVLKPVAGGGTSLTHVVTSSDELVAAAREVGGRSGAFTFVIEEFIEGAEWCIDGVVRDGRLEFFSIGVYAAPVWHIQLGVAIQVRILDPDRDQALYRLAAPFLENSLRALGLGDGVFHLEAFHQPEPERLVFSECAARPGGGPAQETVRYKFGVDLGEEHLRVWCGLPSGLADRPIGAQVGDVTFPTVEGTLISCPSVADLLALPGVVHAVVQTPPGFRMAASSANANMRIGMAVVEAADAGALVRRQEELLAWFADRVVVSDLPGAPQPPWLLRRYAEQGVPAVPTAPRGA